MQDCILLVNKEIEKSLNQNGTIPLGTKAEILSKFLNNCWLIDIQAVGSSIFLINLHFLNSGKHGQRIDVVFDAFVDNRSKVLLVESMVNVFEDEFKMNRMFQEMDKNYWA